MLKSLASKDCAEMLKDKKVVVSCCALLGLPVQAA
jgi:hypothetical protein